MTTLQLPEPDDYRSTIANAIRETRQLITETLGYIAQQEDGPVTMHHALTSIGHAVTDIQLEASYLSAETERWRMIAAKALEQRDEALRQRDTLLGLLSGVKLRRRPH